MINNSSAANTYIHTACKQKMPTGHGVSMSFIQGAIDFFSLLKTVLLKVWSIKALINSTGWTPAVQYSSALVFQPLNIQRHYYSLLHSLMQVKCKP